MLKAIRKNGIMILAMLLFFSSLIYILFFESVSVNGDSMLPTYESGDVLIVQSGNSAVGLNDVVTIDGHKLSEDKDLSLNHMIKRIIGGPGDTVRIENDVLFVNNERVEENFLFSQMECSLDVEIKLKENEFFVLGDNRNNSLDSRVFGSIPRDVISGKVVIQIFNSYD